MSKDDKKDQNKKNISDVFKKIVDTGINAAFMTEDALKSVMTDLSVPKEMMNNVIQNAKNTKNEFVITVKNEMKNYLDKIDVSKEIDKILNRYDLEINAKVSFKPKIKKDQVLKSSDQK